MKKCNISDLRKSKHYAGFTLVELIVVITILVILGTIAFISLGGYSSSARDSNRIGNLNNLKKWLDVFRIKSGVYPTPESPINLTASGITIGTQGFAKDQTANIAKLSAGGITDPSDSTIAVTYSANTAKNKMQIMAFLENPVNTTTNLTSHYSTRTPFVLGDSLGILLGNTGATMNQPIQENAAIIASGSLDVATATGGSYTAYVAPNTTLSGTGPVLLPLLTNYDNTIGTYPGCDTKDIKLPNGQIWAACNVGATNAYVGQTYAMNDFFNPLERLVEVLFPSSYAAMGFFPSPTLTPAYRAFLGSFFQWGRNDDITDAFINSDITSTIATSVPVGHTQFIDDGYSGNWLDHYDYNLWAGSGTTATSGTFASLGSPAAAQGPCATGYHVPTLKEWCDAAKSIDVANIGSCDTFTWYNTTAIDTILKLPAPGQILNDGGMAINGTQKGYYWTTTSFPTNDWAFWIEIDKPNDTFRATAFGGLATGASVRCVKN